MVWFVPSRNSTPLPTPPPLSRSTQTARVEVAIPTDVRTYRVRCTRRQYGTEYFSIDEEAYVTVNAVNTTEAIELAQEEMDQGNVEDWESCSDRHFGDTDYGETDCYEVISDSVEEIE